MAEADERKAKIQFPPDYFGLWRIPGRDAFYVIGVATFLGTFAEAQEYMRTKEECIALANSWPDDAVPELHVNVGQEGFLNLVIGSRNSRDHGEEDFVYSFVMQAYRKQQEIKDIAKSVGEELVKWQEAAEKQAVAK